MPYVNVIYDVYKLSCYYMNIETYGEGMSAAILKTNCQI